MGMFDHVKIDKKFLPKEIREIELEWQSKSHDKMLNTLTIDADGKLFVDNTIDNWVQSGVNKLLPYTGEIRFYSSLKEEKNKWLEFVAFFEKRRLLKCIQVEGEI